MGPGGMIRDGVYVALVAPVRSTRGLAVENATVRWFRVGMSVVPARPMGKAMNSTDPQCFLRAAMRGMYLLVLASSLSSHPRSLQNPISTTMRVQSFLLKEVGSGEGESGTPLA